MSREVEVNTNTSNSDEAALRGELLTALGEIGVDVEVVPYPAHSSIEEGKRRRGDMQGTFTKNLLLRDKKGALFFVTAHEDTDIDLSTLHTRVGGRGRLGFAPPNVMTDLLHITPGTATPLALRWAAREGVTFVVDEVLVDDEQLNFHPMTHTESVGLSWADLERFATSCGHRPMVVAM